MIEPGMAARLRAPDAPGQRARVVVVAFGTLGLALALLTRSQFGLWLNTGALALVLIASAWAVDGPRLTQQLRPVPRTVLVGIGAGLLMGALSHLLYSPIAAIAPAFEQEVRALDAMLDAAPGRYAAIPILCAVVLAEELVFRGIAFDLLHARYGTATAVALAIALYVVPQLASGSWLLPVLALTCGTAWTLLRSMTGGLLAPALCHLCWDLLVMVLSPVH